MVQSICNNCAAFAIAANNFQKNPKLLHFSNIRRKFRSETSDNMDSWKAEVRRVRREKIRRKKMQMREKVGKSRNSVFFQWFGAPEGRKVGSLKRRVRSQLARWEMKNCTPLWREAHFKVKMYKTPQLRTTFGSWDVEKVHAVVARSKFPSQNVQNTPGSDHFWKLRCRKSARRCGAKHISKSKCTKHTRFGPLLELEMLKKCTPLWREAHFEVKSVKNWRSRTTFGGSDVEKVSKKCTPLWREAHFEVKSVKKLRVLSLFWREDVEKVDFDDNSNSNSNNNNNTNHNHNNCNNYNNYNYNNYTTTTTKLELQLQQLQQLQQQQKQQQRLRLQLQLHNNYN